MRQAIRRLGPDAPTSLALLSYWPLYGALFYIAEQFFKPTRYHVMHCWLDDYIPFWEIFIIPYLFWFVYLAGIHVYTFFRDQQAFQRLMWFIIISYSVGLIFFYLFPTVQMLRPTDFVRDNALTEIVSAFYRHDTNTNVCPSLHVVGSMAVYYAARDTELFQRKRWRGFFRVTTVLICISTVFLKQHSVIDVVVGLLVSWVTASLVYYHHEVQLPIHVYGPKRKMSY